MQGQPSMEYLREMPLNQYLPPIGTGYFGEHPLTDMYTDQIKWSESVDKEFIKRIFPVRYNFLPPHPLIDDSKPGMNFITMPKFKWLRESPLVKILGHADQAAIRMARIQYKQPTHYSTTPAYQRFLPNFIFQQAAGAGVTTFGPDPTDDKISRARKSLEDKRIRWAMEKSKFATVRRAAVRPTMGGMKAVRVGR